jgi:hypothetical protein
MNANKEFYDVYSQFRNRMQSLYILNLRSATNDVEEVETAKRLIRDLPINLDENEISDFSFIIDQIALKFQSRETIEVDEVVKDYGMENLVEFDSSKTTFSYKPEVTKSIEEWATKNKKEAKKLISFQRRSRINSPARGDVIRQGVLVYLVTYFEMLLGDLFRIYFSLFPGKLSKDKTFKYEDILRLETLDAITQQVISEEANALLRLGYKDAPNAFQKKTGVDISEVKVYSNKLIELFERRNIFVHNSGRIDNRYMKKVPNSYLKQINARENLLLSVSNSYLQEGIEAVLVVGTIISQRIWRKYSKDCKLADYALTELIFEKLVEGRYGLVINLADFALGIAFSNKSSRYAVLINSAIAYDKLGEPVKKERTLNRIGKVHDLPLAQQVAYYCVNLETDRAISLLQTAIANGDIDEIDLRDWPAFEYLATDPRLREITQGLINN